MTGAMGCDQYRDFLRAEFSSITLGLTPHVDAPQAPIDQVYVPPYFRSASQRSPEYEGSRVDPMKLRGSVYGDRRSYQWESVAYWYPDQHSIHTVEQLLASHARLVVLGEVGAGKTTLLAYIISKALEHAAGFGFTPLYYRLRQLPSTSSALLPLHPGGEIAAETFARQALAEDRCLLLFDGLDEVDEGNRQWVLDQIDMLLQRYPQQRALLTSRPDALTDVALAESFHRVFIDGLSAPHVERLVRRFYRMAQNGSGARYAHQLIDAMRASEALFSGGLSPLLLKALANLQLEGLDLRSAWEPLCYRCMHLLLEDWDSIKGIANFFLPDYKLRILQPIALHLLRQGRAEGVVEEIEAVATARGVEQGLRPEYVLPLLDEIARRNGILVARRQGYLRFAHGWLQYYLAARELSELPDGAEELAECTGDPAWDMTCVFYAARSDASQLVGLLLGRDDPFCGHLLLAGQCAALAQRIHPALRDQAVRELVNLCLTSNYEPLVSRACKVLMEIGTPEAMAHVENWLWSGNEDRRVQAHTVMAGRPLPQFVDQLSAQLHADSSKAIRCLSADMLGRLGHGRRELLAALEDGEWQVRYQALEALRWRDEEALIPLFARYLEEGYWCGRQLAAAPRLAELFGGIEEQILRQTTGDKDDAIRKVAAQALAELETPRATEMLESLTSHANWHVRLFAAWGFMMTGGRAQHVLHEAAEHPDDSVRYALVSVLNETSAYPLLEQGYMEMAEILLQDTAWRVRGALLTGWHVDTDALLHLIEPQVDDPIAYVHVRAVRALGTIHLPRTRRLLLSILAEAKRDGLVLGASQGLARHRCTEAEPLILEQLQRGWSENVLYGPLNYLFRLGSPEAMPYLVPYLQHASPELRGLAFECTRRICARCNLDPPAVLRSGGGQRVCYEAQFIRRYDTTFI